MEQDSMNQDFVPGKPPKKGMSRNTKIVLGVVGVLLGLCCVSVIVVGIIFQRGISNFEDSVDDPAAAANTAAEIVDYQLPAGFQEEGVMNLFGVDMVFMSGQGNEAIIMLMSFPNWMAGNEEQMQVQMEESINENFSADNLSFTFVESREVSINDQNVTVNVYEGTDDDGVAYRQASGLFEGDNGKPSMFMVIAPTARWDSSNLDGFIDSLD